MFRRRSEFVRRMFERGLQRCRGQLKAESFWRREGVVQTRAVFVDAFL